MTFSQPSIRIRCPDDLLAVVPYLCGNHHADGSLVVVGFRGPRLAYAARDVLPEPGAEVEQATQLVAQVATRTAGVGSDVAALVAYGPAARVDPIAAAAPAAFVACRIWLAELLRVTSGRWWSYLCTNPDCCPPQGRVLDPASPCMTDPCPPRCHHTDGQNAPACPTSA